MFEGPGEVEVKEEEAMTEFQCLCRAILGRPYLWCESSWPSCPMVFLQAFSDLVQLQQPWWQLFSRSGLFYFRRHMLINFEKTAKSLCIDPTGFKDLLAKDGFLEAQHPEGLVAALLKVIKDSVEDWCLYEIPETPDGRKLKELMIVMKCSDVLDFEDLKITPIITKPGRKRIYDTEKFEIKSIEPEPERLAMAANPGEFYKSLIPPERISTSPKSWLFRGLSEL